MVGQQPPPRVHLWNNPSLVAMPAPLHPLPKHPEIWLQKFNLDDGVPSEEHLHNYMLAINLNGVDEEYCIVRLFPYTLIGSAGSWYMTESLHRSSLNCLTLSLKHKKMSKISTLDSTKYSIKFQLHQPLVLM